MSRHPNPSRLRVATRLAILGGGLALLAAAPAPPCIAGDTAGFIYGTVTTDRGSTYEGRMRWGNEESSWGDLFNSVKQHRITSDKMPETRSRREPIRVFGITIGMRWEDRGASRTFKARFGDIDKIKVGRNEQAVVVMKSGTEYEIDGGSNDLGGKIQIWDPGLGKVEVAWERIDTIDFKATPKNLEVQDHRLHAVIHTQDGEFRGFIQWDQDECLSSDRLDGDTDDAKLSLEMGRIREIKRLSRRRSQVTLKDGREFELEGSNDVNSENRGIYVDDPLYGRVLVSWDAFKKAEFTDAGNNGPAYDSFKPGEKLRGKVTDLDGATHRGRIVFDLDEGETWELFDGNANDIEYAIPMGMIASIIPESSDSARVVLRNRKELEFEDTADTGDGNGGILVFGDDFETYVAWDDLARIDFER